MRWTRMWLVTVVALFALTPAALANTYRVTGTGDDIGATCFADVCPTLRAAVEAAASPGGPHTISLPAGTYQLTQRQLLLNSDVTIAGAGARTTAIRGNPEAFRVVEVTTGRTVAINGVTLRDGRATDENTPTFFAGGVVLNHGSLTLDRVRVTGGSASSGGGVANTGGTLVVERSLIDHNAANIGGSDSGGLLNFAGGRVTVRNTTIAFNQALPGKSGGYLSWGGPGNTALFEFVTLAHNTGGGLNYATGDTLQLRGSIVANNIGGNCLTAPQSLGNNVETSDDCLLEQRGAGNAVEDELENRGGDTDVLASVPGSAAADLIPAGQCLPTDQRGIARPIGPACDAGAFEAGTAPVTITSPAPESTTEAATVELRGTAEPNASVTVYRNGTSVGQTSADGQGAWAVTVNLEPGEQTFEVESPGTPRAAVRVVRTVPVQPTPTPVTTVQPTPTPTPRPTETPAPQPDVGESVVIRPTAGRVFIQLPGSSQFVELRSIGEIPLGATIDTRNGRVQLRFETEDGKVQTATFYGGIFQIRQVGKTLDLKLTEPLAACPKKGKAAAAQTKKVKKRKLWGEGKGSFRTTGKYSAATVRGTKWLVEDSCAGTLTRVTIGVVAVRAGKKTVLVRAGKRYLAKPR